nr:GNAT family N-acetyltransferase [uncultured Albidiferax sp.]
MASDALPIDYRCDADVSDAELNTLFAQSWPGHQDRSFRPVLQTGFTSICAYSGEALVGFVNIAWDGQSHAFVLDPTVTPAFRRQGIGRQLVLHGIAAAKNAGLAWIHVDFEPALRGFYQQCGFQTSEAGVIQLASFTPASTTCASTDHCLFDNKK